MSVEIFYIVMLFSLTKEHIQVFKPFKFDLLVEYEKPQNDLCLYSRKVKFLRYIENERMKVKIIASEG